MMDKNRAHAPQRGIGIKARLRAKLDLDWRLPDPFNHVAKQLISAQVGTYPTIDRARNNP
jgi:hypothetical protein